MIELAKISVLIATPVSVAFNYISNMENYKHWFPGVVDIKSTNQLAHGDIGKKYVETLLLPSGAVDLEINVNQCKPNHFFLTQGNLASVLPQMTVTFLAITDSSCKVTLEYHSRNSELTSSSDIVIALREDLDRRAKQGITELKTILESSSLL